MTFPENFIWGAASAAYQIEGACREDGRGASIWDTFSHQPGATFEGDNGDVACDGYHRYEADIALMAELGIKAYRLSLSWPRIFPQGDGAINPAGLAYYDHVADCCLRHGIEPYFTLYHWDLPQALADKGGWENRHTCEAFAQYCGAVAEHFRGRVSHYFTINEIQCVVMLGYASGIHAPRKRLPLADCFSIWHHVLLAHGLGYQAIRGADPAAKISFASTGRLCSPQRAESDLEAARQATFSVSDDDWMFTHQMALDPIVLGHYPEAEEGELRKLIAQVPQADLDIIHTGVDELGANIYNGSTVRQGRDGRPEYVPNAPGCRRTAIKWPVTPEVMRYGPQFLWERYRVPVVITENGVSCNDFIWPDGGVHDGDRINFLTLYLQQLQAACQSGVPVSGYFHWALTDNFEWQNGYSERFGLIYVDYATQKRTPKDSATWYRQVISSNGAALDRQ